MLDVGLIEKRKRAEGDREGLSTAYRATGFGEVVLTEGVDELLCGGVGLRDDVRRLKRTRRAWEPAISRGVNLAIAACCLQMIRTAAEFEGEGKAVRLQKIDARCLI